jgi:hypothetical protein
MSPDGGRSWLRPLRAPLRRMGTPQLPQLFTVHSQGELDPAKGL